MPRVHFVKKARKDNPAVKAGESYYHWSFRFGGKRYSKTYPKRSQLTQSGFLSELYDLQDGIDDRFKDLKTGEDFDTALQDLISEVEGLRDECQDSLDNMPEHLQDSSSSGELLRERVDALEQWVSELDGVDTDFDEELTEDELQDEIENLIMEITSIEVDVY
jgi:chromosome segregation ATPase